MLNSVTYINIQQMQSGPKLSMKTEFKIRVEYPTQLAQYVQKECG